MAILAIAMVALAACLMLGVHAGPAMAQTPPTATVPALAPYIDAHVHVDAYTPGAVRSMESMTRQNAAKIFMLVPPFTFNDPARYEAEVLFPIAGAASRPAGRDRRQRIAGHHADQSTPPAVPRHPEIQRSSRSVPRN